MGAEPTPLVLRIQAWPGRGTLTARAEGVPTGRRCPPVARGGWDDRFFWKDRTGDRAGMTWFDTRIGWSCERLAAVRVLRIDPAQGAGRFELSLVWDDDPAPRAILATDRCHEEDADWFEATGRDLAGLLGVAYRFDTGADA